MKVNNIKVSEYFNKSNTAIYDVVFKVIPPVNKFMGVECDMNSLTFDEVSAIKILLNSINEDSLKSIYAICYHEYLPSGKVIEFLQSYRYILDEFKKIHEREFKLLQSIPDPKLIAAGIDRLNKFKTLNTKISLAEQFGKKPSEIGQWKYSEVLLIQAYNKELKEITKNIK